MHMLGPMDLGRDSPLDEKCSPFLICVVFLFTFALSSLVPFFRSSSFDLRYVFYVVLFLFLWRRSTRSWPRSFFFFAGHA
jgi:hypothetical protein